MKKIVFIYVLSVLISSCTSDFTPAIFNTVELQTDYQADISMIYDVAEGSNTLSNTINKELEHTIVTMVGIDTTLTELTSVLDAFENDYVEFKIDFPESPGLWELHIETEKIYQSDEVITIAISVYQYQGGAHGNDEITLLNLDAKTGRVLKPNDYIKDTDRFTALAKTYFIKNLDQGDEPLKMEDYFFGESFHLPENIGYSDEGLILLYNVYEVASYAQGYTEFIIPFEIADTYLKLY